MKKEFNILKFLLITSIVIIAGILALTSTRDLVDYGQLTQVRIKVMGTMIPSGDEYALSLENGKWVASHEEIEWLEGPIREQVVDEKFVDQIREILKENKAHKWNSFNLKYEINKLAGSNSTDGTTYKFYMSFSDGTTITIDEYNLYPDTYMSVFHAFEKEFENLFGDSE